MLLGNGIRRLADGGGAGPRDEGPAADDEDAGLAGRGRGRASPPACPSRRTLRRRRDGAGPAAERDGPGTRPPGRCGPRDGTDGDVRGRGRVDGSRANRAPGGREATDAAPYTYLCTPPHPNNLFFASPPYAGPSLFANCAMHRGKRFRSGRGHDACTGGGRWIVS